MAQVVEIGRVIPLRDGSSKYLVGKMKKVLQEQGQIEPLQVHEAYQMFYIFSDDPWGNEIVRAAQELGWPTLLVTVMKKYEG